ncbi:MAG: DNA-binding domain-containing protein [Anaeromyxobacter sp.]
MTLAETQALFHAAITGEEPLAAEQLEACFLGTPELPAADRVAIYSGMYLARLVDALRATYPALARFLGDETFHGLAEDYLRRHPSEHHDVGNVGRHLPAFLRAFPDPERPDLADLAALEWARQEVFFAPVVEPLGREAFAELEGPAFLRTGLTLSPALRLLVLEHAATDLWRSVEAGEPPGPPAPGPAAVAVWRRGFEVFHCALALDEAAALEAAASGVDLGGICAAFSGREDAAAAAFEALSGWLAEGWVAALVAA